MVTMAYHKFILTIIYLCTIYQVISADEACDKSKCKGPIAYYEELKCIPIYGEDKCCPLKYNCAHLEGRSTDKCYYKDHVYDLNQSLRAEDARPCDKLCVCAEGYTGIAGFRCAIVDCFARAKPGCYLKAAHDQCCNGPEVCPEVEPKPAKCEVDGKTYYAGQRFEPQSDPTLSCICNEGYTGENVEPFCKPHEPRSCGTELRHAANIHKNCPPVFYSNQNPATDCYLSSRCQNKDDVVLPAAVPSTSDPAAVCKFGDLTMNLGDELNQGTGYESVCVKCLCEVPPLPTCQRLPDSECDVTVHKKFDDF